MALITYGQAQRHLRLVDDSEKQDIELKMEMATAIVTKHVKETLNFSSSYWSEDTDPAEDRDFAIVQCAILKVLANLYGDRGDNEKPSGGPLSKDVTDMLSELRDPSMA